jgi:hypothetical protein
LEAGSEQLGHVSQVYGWHPARASGEETALGVPRDLEQPAAKQFVIPKLSGLLVNR